MITNESKSFVKHILYNCKCRFYDKECNINWKWNKDKCHCECKEQNEMYTKKTLYEILDMCLWVW